MCNPKSQYFTHLFPSKNFIVLALKCRSLTHCELIFAYDVKVSVQIILLHVDTQVFPPLFIVKTTLPHGIALTSLLESNDHKCKDLFLDPQFYFFGLYVYLYVSITLCGCCSFVVTFGIEKYESYNFFLLFQDCFGILGLLHLHMYFRISWCTFSEHQLHVSLYIYIKYQCINDASKLSFSFFSVLYTIVFSIIPILSLLPHFPNIPRNTYRAVLGIKNLLTVNLTHGLHICIFWEKLQFSFLPITHSKLGRSYLFFNIMSSLEVSLFC